MRPAARLASFVYFLGVAIPTLAGFASTEVFLPAVGRIPGQGGAQFYTTLWATNLTAAPQTFKFELLKVGQANPTPPSFTDTLQPGQTKVYENVVESKLGLANALGAGRVTSSGEIFVSERIYNVPPGADLGNTEGLFFAGVPKTFSISAGQSASIQGIDQGASENFRYNFALVETGGGSPTVNVQVFDGNGALLGQKSYPLQPYEQLQPGVGDVVPGISTTNARITATVTGGTGSVLLAGAQLANESQDSSGFEMSFRDSLLGTSGGTAGVTSLNGLTGALTLKPGNGISITPSGSSIDIAFTGGGGSGITSVTHDASLTGAGTGASPLAIANGQVVRSLTVGPTMLHDAVTLAAGSNITLTPSGSTLTIASGGGGSLTLPFTGSTSAAGWAFEVTNAGAGDALHGEAGDSSYAGVAGINSGAGQGVYGASDSGDGVRGISTQVSGVHGSSQGASGSPVRYAGVWGDAGGAQRGVLGTSAAGDGVFGVSSTGNGVDGFSTSDNGVYGESHSSTGLSGVAGVWGDSDNGAGVYGTTSTYQGVTGSTKGGSSTYGVFSYGTLGATGAKTFVEPHPIDPTKEIRFVALEGPESGTYFRGTARTVGGFATIQVPESFRMVTDPDGLTVVVTPVGELAVMACIRSSLDTIVVQSSRDVQFHYMVNGVRKAFKDFEVISENLDFVPRSDDGLTMRAGLPAESIRRLVATGILKKDGTVNMETVRRLGWDKRPGWKPAEAARN